MYKITAFHFGCLLWSSLCYKLLSFISNLRITFLLYPVVLRVLEMAVDAPFLFRLNYKKKDTTTKNNQKIKSKKCITFFIYSSLPTPMYSYLLTTPVSEQKIIENLTTSLFSLRLTITLVICWSKNTRMEANSAGKQAAIYNHHGFLLLIGLMTQSRFEGSVGWNFVGTVNFGVSRPTAASIPDIAMIAMNTAKSLVICRT